jgi:replicative DNA helicase
VNAEPGGLFGLAAPPMNVAAEQAVLGTLLANNRAYDLVGHLLKSAHFADPLHGLLYGAIAARIDSGRLADAVTMMGEAGSWADGETDPEAARRYVAELVAAMIGLPGVPDYARVIHDCWLRRSVMEIAEVAYYAARDTGRASGLEVLRDTETALFALADTDAAEVSVPAHVPMAEAVANAVANRDQAGGIVGLRTGLQALDEFTGGLRPGQLFYIGGRPSMGKTSFGLAIGAGAARTLQNDGRPARVLFVSREMPVLAIGEQLIAGLAPVPRDAATRGKVRGNGEHGLFEYRPITDDEVASMLAAQRDMVDRYLVLDECRAGTLAAVRSRAMRMKRRGGLDLIVADYLGLFDVPELARVGNRVLEVTRLSRDAKALARDLAVPVVMLCQLSRGTEGREDKRPTLADLRDSGSLEQDGDIVAFLYREHYYLTRKPPARAEFRQDADHADAVTRWTADEKRARGRAELLIPKQRGGRVGKIELAFNDETTWFSDLVG